MFAPDSFDNRRSVYLFVEVLSETRLASWNNDLRWWHSDTESSPTAADPRRSAAAGLHRQVQRGLSAEHAPSQSAAAEGDLAEKHNYRSDPQH